MTKVKERKLPRPEARGLTIDDVSTRDIDDAFWVEPKEDGGWSVSVSIADVSSRISRENPLDARAYEMTSTRYFATGNSPMLPHRFSQGELSLFPGKERKVVSFDLEISPTFSVRLLKIEKRRLTSKVKLTYREIPTLLKDERNPWHSMLKETSKIAFGLLERRRAAGAMVLYDLNNGWVMTDEGFLKQLKNHQDTLGYILIQELMIATNSAAAHYAVTKDIPFLFRNHTARSAAPDREDLLAQLRDAIDKPIQNLDTVRQRFHMVMDRADYGAVLLGHYGLNLAAYTHVTSPIRRYADLVNQRQLLGKNPYSAEELKAIAEHINEVEQQERQSRHEHEVDRANRKAENHALDARRLDGLNAKDFERVLKMQVRAEGDPSEPFVINLEQRIKENRLPLICFAILIHEAPQTEIWTRLKERLFIFLEKHLSDVSTVWTLLSQGYNWPLPTHEVTGSGPPHAQVFKAQAIVEPRSGFEVCHGAFREARTSKEAKQAASLNLLGVVCGFEVAEPPLPPPPAPPPPKKKAAPQDPNKNPISTLQEISQVRGSVYPTYTYVTSGPDHIPEVWCTCLFGQIEKKAKAGSKKDAKRLAAQAVIQALEEPT